MKLFRLTLPLIIIGLNLLAVTIVLADTNLALTVAPTQPPVTGPDEGFTLTGQALITATTLPQTVIVVSDSEGGSLRLQSGNTLTMTLAPGERDSRQFKYCNAKSNPNNTTADLIWSIAESFPAPGAEWLESISPTSGTIPAPPPGQLQNCQTLTAVFDATDLEAREEPYATTVTFKNSTAEKNLPDAVLNVELVLLENIEVKIRAFIPCEAVDYADPADLLQFEMFGGDGRSFSYNNGTSRVEQTTLVTLNPSATNPRLDLEKTWVVTTTQYSEDDGEKIPGQDEYWCKGLKPTAAEPEKKRQDIPDMADVSRTDDGVKVHLDIDVGNPFFLDGWTYPNTDAEIDIILRQDSGKPPQYKIDGEHDGFPAYEIYLNGKLIHCHNPLDGDSPLSLLPPMDVEFKTDDWKQIEPIVCRPIKGIKTHSPIGEPGSQFTVTGNRFGASDLKLRQSLENASNVVNVFINDILLGSVNPDIEGRFQFNLNTSNASLGKYIVRVDEVATGESYQAQFNLEEDTFIVPPLNEVETTFDVPADIALPPYQLFLPIIWH